MYIALSKNYLSHILLYLRLAFLKYHLVLEMVHRSDFCVNLD